MLRVASLLACALPLARSAQTHVYVNWGNESTSVVVTWTDADPGSVVDVVQWSLSPAFANAQTTPPGALTNYSTPAGGKGIFGPLPAYDSGTIHRATLTGVPATGARVFYRIGSALNGWGFVGNFTSHPGVGANVPVRVLVLADHDVDCYTDVTGKVCDPAAVVAAVAAPAVRDTITGGAIILGDLAYANGNQSHWDYWQDLFAPLTARLVRRPAREAALRLDGGDSFPPHPPPPCDDAACLPWQTQATTSRKNLRALTSSSPSRRASAACPTARAAPRRARSSTRTR